MSIVTATHFSYCYPGIRKRALNDLNFEVKQGEVLGVIGPVGAGKSTLSMALGGIIPRVMGGATIGQLVHRLPPEKGGTGVGVVFEDCTGQLTQLKAIQEVTSPLLNMGMADREAEEQARHWLDKVGLAPGEMAQKYVWDLSCGQQQRLALAATLASNPQLLILDSVNAMLDVSGRSKVRKILDDLIGQKTLVIVEDDPRLLLAIADRVMVLVDGRIEALAPVREVLLDYDLLRRADVEPPLPLRIAKALSCEASPGSGEELARLVSVQKPMLMEKRVAASSEGEVVVDMENVCFQYRPNDPVIDQLNLKVRAGEVHVIVGHSGAGKTTLAKLIAGLLKPNCGRVSVGGYDTRKTKVAKLAETVGSVLQNPDQQISEATVLKEVAFPLRQRKVNADTIEQRVRHALEWVGLDSGLFENDPVLLPLAQRKQVTIAEALVVDPRVLVLDEPATSFGRSAREKLKNLFERLKSEGKAIIVIENDIDLVAEIADTVTVLEQGRVRLSGPVAEVFDYNKKQRLFDAGMKLPSTSELGELLGIESFRFNELVGQLTTEPAAEVH